MHRIKFLLFLAQEFNRNQELIRNSIKYIVCFLKICALNPSPGSAKKCGVKERAHK